ncbi:hypothetical protein Tco_1449224 [Tanacetum coccineum]
MFLKNQAPKLENISPADNEIASLMDTTVHHEEPSSQTSSLYTVPVMIIPEVTVVDHYIDNKLGEAIPKAITSHTAKCREEARAEKEEYIDLIDTSSLNLQIFLWTRWRNINYISHVRADYKKELYDALVKFYNTSKDLFDTYGKVFMLKRGRDDKDKDQDPSAGSDRGTKRRKSSKEAESSRDQRSKESKSSRSSKGTSRSHHKSSGKSAHAEEPIHTVEDSRVRQNQEFDTGNNDEQPDDETAPKGDWFKKPERPPTPDPEWNKRQHDDFRPPQTWISDTARVEKPPTSFDELMDTKIDFSAFVLNWLNIMNLTQELLLRPAFNLLKGTCRSLRELEYHFEECFKATTERLDWHNPKGKPYPFDLYKPLPLILDHRGRQVIPREYFINNDLEYLKGGSLSRQYSTSVTKSKAATYEVKWIKDMVPNLWSLVKVVYDKHAYWGYLDKIEVRREDQQLYTFKEDPQGVIYVDLNNKNRWMRTDELHKFSDGTLNSVRTVLHDIASRIRIEYLPKRKWSGLDKRRAHVMIQDIDKQLFQRRLMRNLEKFVGGREYGEDLRLLERTI